MKVKFSYKQLLIALIVFFHSCSELETQKINDSIYENKVDFLSLAKRTLEEKGRENPNLELIDWEHPLLRIFDKQGNEYGFFFIKEAKEVTTQKESDNTFDKQEKYKPRVLTFIREGDSDKMGVCTWRTELKKEDKKNEFNGEFHFYHLDGSPAYKYAIEGFPITPTTFKKKEYRSISREVAPTLYNGNSNSTPEEEYIPTYDLGEVTVRARRRQQDPFEGMSFGSSFGMGGGMGFGMGFAQEAQMMHMQQMQMRERMMIEAAQREAEAREREEREAREEAERLKREAKEKQERKAKEEAAELARVEELFEGIKSGKFFQEAINRRLFSYDYKFGVRAFAPFDMFGGGFEGDGKDRKFDLSPEASSRIHQYIYLDTKSHQLFTESWAQETRHPSRPSRTAIPNSKIIEALKVEAQNGAEVFTFATHVEAGNPVAKQIPIVGLFVPDIDIFAYLSVKEEKLNNEAVVSGKLTGDNFPSTEAFVRDRSGQAVFLGIGFYEKEGIPALFGANRDREIMSFEGLRIKKDEQGNFTHIKTKEMEEFISIEQWNKPYMEADPFKNDPDRTVENSDICVIM